MDPRPPQKRTAPSKIGASSETSRESPAYAAGEVVADKYELRSVIGEGGMGAVWLARNRTLDVDVALKLVRADVTSQEASDRLLREARATARLKHASIVRIHDFGETHRGDPFIVMELLNGESWADVLGRKGSVTPTRAVQTLLPICGALADAHALGVVHRDLKPENVILVAERGGQVVPKLVDFGIAKVEGGPDPVEQAPDRDAAGAQALARKLTQTGALMGSPDYMAPEQARGDSTIDERTDLWALAVMLYEAIAGRRPFEAERLEDLLLAILLEDPTPLPDLDATLWGIIARGLRNDRTSRWQHAREMGRALAAWLSEQGVTTDITGASVEQHWLRVGGASAAPPPAEAFVERDPLGVDHTPARVPASSPARAERPPRRMGWIVGLSAGVVFIALAVGIGFAMRSDAGERTPDQGDGRQATEASPQSEGRGPAEGERRAQGRGEETAQGEGSVDTPPSVGQDPQDVASAAPDGTPTATGAPSAPPPSHGSTRPPAPRSAPSPTPPPAAPRPTPTKDLGF